MWILICMHHPYCNSGIITVNSHGLPNDINGTAIYYNKKLFDEANLPYP